MQFTDLFIKRPVLACVLSLVIFLTGLIAYNKLAVRQYPAVSANVVTISTSYSGASASLVEAFVTTPLEQALQGISGVDYVSSVSSAGNSRITVSLNLNADLYQALIEINNDLTPVLKKLPSGVDTPVIKEGDSNSTPMMIISFSSSKLTPEAINDYLQRVVQPQLANLSGVAQANILGPRVYAMRLWLNPAKMAALGVTTEDVSTALAANDLFAQAGSISTNSQVININIESSLNSAAQFNNLVIKSQQDQYVRLSDIGYAELGAQTKASSLYVNGKPAVGVGIIAKSDANPLMVANTVKNEVAEIQKQLPQGLSVRIARDSSSYIQDSLSEVSHTVMVAIVIVIAVVLLFLGSFRALMIPLVTIPVSLVGTFALMYLLGYSINVLTLLAFVLAIGLVVDDAIVVLENVHRYIEQGFTPFKAALKGAREIRFAIIAMTLTLAAVYAPIGFSTGITGSLFREFAFSLAASVILSGIVALTLSPMMCARMMRAHHQPAGWQLKIEVCLTRLRDYYSLLLNKVFNNKVNVLIIAGTVIVCGGIYIIPLVKNSTLAPKEDQNTVIGIVQGSMAASVVNTEAYTSKLRELASKVSGVENVTVINGAGGDQSNAMLMVQLASKSQRSLSAERIAGQLNKAAARIPGAKAMFVLPPSLPTSHDNYDIEFVIKTNGDYAELETHVNKILQAIHKNAGFGRVMTDLQFNKPEYNVTIQRDMAARLGVSVSGIASVLTNALAEPQSSEFVNNGLSYYVIPQVIASGQGSITGLNQLYVTAESGAKIPLRDLIKVKMTVNPSSLNHFQSQRSVTIQATLSHRYSTEQALNFLEMIAKKDLTAQMSYATSGNTRQYLEESSSVYFIFIAALLFIYLSLSAQFESFIDPLIILMSVPFSIAGALGTLFLIGGSLNIYTEIGLVTLIGLIAKHGILIVEFANQSQKSGESLLVAIKQSARVRFRPILMTTAAMVLGAVPLVFASGAGSEARYQLGWVIVGGMMIGTMMTLLVLPLMYYLVNTAKTVFKDKRKFRLNLLER
ncbi:Efflux pump membrane transporter BepE [Piscirickettsia salmonis]|uniref:MMPL family protein n=1 Tax=Piscirickettsia salmonis TaxID=1238 RepID=A0A1L6TC91_PISSA|nr:efflux RND transporter permease subunit [Piscirickettsia salmonis]AKP74110.1 MMPL family protein [Piscirickettsia salmonis LF-89 = ATCC VR-1361]ALB22984.1 MMPL family protein [Piscirickettsia salmonis]ALY02931.1 MMPL family protein [Piscirickettsia salmonis]AMA42487.1 MMPL family protein [Piscirickettsia salmonis]AOS34957.1 MMPL family protein [Piscirickettsia salmonis]